MARRRQSLTWARLVQRQVGALTRTVLRAATRAAAAGAAGMAGTALRQASPRAKTRTVGLRSQAMPLRRVIAADGTRSYRIHIPPTLPTSARPPLLVMLHGCQQSAAELASSTRMNQLADAHGFVVMYPQQDRLANPHGCWNWFDSRSGRAAREAASIMAAIAQVCAAQRVDPARVAVAGLSSGASMAALLALHHPGRFAAVVMHSGVDPRLAHSSATALAAMRGRGRLPTATPTAPGAPGPALLVIQGSDDAVVAKVNGMRAARAWAQAAQARAGAPRRVQRGRRHAITTMDWHAGKRLVATLVEVAGLGHAWSGGTRAAFADPDGPDASRMVWAFARKQFATGPA